MTDWDLHYMIRPLRKTAEDLADERANHIAKLIVNSITAVLAVLMFVALVVAYEGLTR